MRLTIPFALLLVLALAGPSQARQNETDLAGARTTIEEMRALAAEGRMYGAKAKALYSGDWLHRLPNVRDEQPEMAPPVTALVATGRDTAVARLTRIETPATDFYYYLRRGTDRRWTIEAGRSLAVPEFVFELRRQLEAKKDRTPDDDATLRNLQLTMMTDAELTDWFAAHRRDLDGLLQMASAGGKTGARSSKSDKTDIGAVLARLDVSGLDDEDNAVRVVIGGVLDNDVGFLHVASGGKPPPMDQNAYIWIEPLSGGWYLFRTT